VSSAFDRQSSLRYSDAVPWTALKTRRLAQARAANEVYRAADQIPDQQTIAVL